jgi:hypothetical protein
MVPLDAKNCAHFRQVALNMALSEEGPINPDNVVAAATKYFDFLSLGLAPEPTALPHSIPFPAPSGMPADPIGGVVVTDMHVTDLQALRRQQLLELDIVANAIKANGAVPC